MARRSSLDGFPLRGGKASWASLKRQVIGLGIMLDYFALGAGRGLERIAMMAVRAIALAKAI
jgi:hypothetical protein